MNLFLRGSVAIARIEKVSNLHTFDYLAEGRESLWIERTVLVVVDKDLCCTAMRFRSLCEGHSSSCIGLQDGIVLDGLIPPFRACFWIPCDSKLGYKFPGGSNDSENSIVVVVSLFYESSKSFRS